MPYQARLGDICVPSGDHVLWSPTSFNSASPNVIVNDLGATRVTDSYAVHCLGSSCHSPIHDTGSSNVIINGLSAARLGDKTDCGHTVATGSHNVITGG